MSRWDDLKCRVGMHDFGAAESDVSGAYQTCTRCGRSGGPRSLHRTRRATCRRVSGHHRSPPGALTDSCGDRTRPGPRAARPGLAQHRRRDVLDRRAARPVRAAGLLDLLLRQLPARHRRAAAAGGEVRRGARRGRRALAEVRARGRPGRAAARRSSGTACTTRCSTTRSWSPGRPTRPGPGRRWCWSTRRATSSRSTPARGTRTRSTACSASWSRSTAPRGRSSRATRRTSRPRWSRATLRFPADAVPLGGRARPRRRRRARPRRRARRATGGGPRVGRVPGAERAVRRRDDGVRRRHRAPPAHGRSTWSPAR